MDLTTILSSIQVQNLLSENTAKEISERTGIPIGTIKNYKSGRSDIEYMPVKLREQLSKAYLGVMDVSLTHYFLDDELWEKAKRENYDPVSEAHTLVDLYHYRQFHSRDRYNLKYFFLPDLEYFKNLSISTSMNDVLMFGIHLGIRIVIPLSQTGNLRFHIQTTRVFEDWVNQLSPDDYTEYVDDSIQLKLDRARYNGDDIMAPLASLVIGTSRFSEEQELARQNARVLFNKYYGYEVADKILEAVNLYLDNL